MSRGLPAPFFSDETSGSPKQRTLVMIRRRSIIVGITMKISHREGFTKLYVDVPHENVDLISVSGKDEVEDCLGVLLFLNDQGVQDADPHR